MNRVTASHRETFLQLLLLRERHGSAGAAGAAVLRDGAVALVFSRLHATSARINPTLLARGRVQRCRTPIGNRLFATSQDDGIVVERWRRTLKLAALDRLQNISAGWPEPECTPPLERCHGTGHLRLVVIFVQRGAMSVEHADFVA